jgi:TetR/AcrR family transcriptional repressor of nem operon
MRATERAMHALLLEADLPAGKDPAELARFLTTALQGVRVMAKATRDERLVRDSIDVALRALD